MRRREPRRCARRPTDGIVTLTMMASRSIPRLGRIALALCLIPAGGHLACAAEPVAVTSSTTTAVAASGTKRALLIGINNYQAVPHLMGSLNDVAAMQRILTTRWGFPPSNIKTLTEQAATRTAILAALREMVQVSGPGDTLVVHFSGHGSQVQDLNGDEDDGLDETLVPYDGRTPGVPDIVDDELDEIFSRLRTSTVLIVLDSCHSGTATRAVDFRTRGIPQDMRIDLYQQPATTTRAIVPRMESRFLVMSAVAADQEALDGPIDSEYHGIFTYALSKSLAVSPPGASPRDVFSRVGQEIKRLQTQFGRDGMPEPQLEGPPALLDKPLLAAAGGSSGAASPAGPRLAWLEVQPGPEGQVILSQGALLGAAPGSKWAIYPPGETAFAPGRALAVATVTGNTGLNAYATLQPSSAHLQSGSRAVALMPAAADQRIPVRILDVPKASRTQIETVLVQTIKNVEIVGSGKPARFLIDVHEGTLRLLAADGRQVVATFDTHTDQWADGIARVISRSSSASELLALDNPTSQIRLRAQVVGAAQGAARDIVLVADTQPAQLHIRHPNEPRTARNSLQIAVTVDTDAYITIVDVDSQGNTNLLFPNSYQRSDFWPDGRVLRNQQLMIPDSLAPGGRAGFNWDYGPPAGNDTIRIFASTDAATARLIRDRIRTLQSGASGTRGVESATKTSEGLNGLRQELTGLATRGIVMVQDASPNSTAEQLASSTAADWAAISLTVSVAE
jgi:Caspase domain/Domain of unknown function (DUF4384)